MSVLEQILTGVRADLERRMADLDLVLLERQLARRGLRLSPDQVVSALQGTDGVRVIAEVKRSSPTGGVLSAITDPASLAISYAAGGAAAISVLTEAKRFGGSLDDLDAVRGAVDVPLLRKDFVLDPYQLVEGAAHGADIALLIVAALAQSQLEHLLRVAADYGLTALVEVHDGVELTRAVDAGARVVGVNARDLTTLEVDRGTFARLVGAIPEGVVAVAESGVRRPEDVVALAEAGADAVLVGTSLVVSERPQDAVASLVAAGRREAA